MSTLEIGMITTIVTLFSVGTVFFIYRLIKAIYKTIQEKGIIGLLQEIVFGIGIAVATTIAFFIVLYVIGFIAQVIINTFKI